MGMDGGAPDGRVAAATPSAGSNHGASSSPVARSGWACADRVEGGGPERGDDHARGPPGLHHQVGHPLAMTGRSGSKPGSPGRFLISMLTRHAVRRPRGRRPTAGRRRGARPRPARRRAHPGDHRVVVDGQGPVRGHPDIQLDAVGSQLTGPEEGVEGVLADPGCRVGAAPVGLDGDRSHRLECPPRRPPPGGRTGAAEARIQPRNCLQPWVPVITLMSEP